MVTEREKEYSYLMALYPNALQWLGVGQTKTGSQELLNTGLPCAQECNNFSRKPESVPGAKYRT